MKLKKLETNKPHETTMNKNTKLKIAKTLTLLALAGFTACIALADTQTETIPFTQQSGGSGSGCPGAYTGLAKMTNSAGTFWITPPTNTTSGTLTDVSGFPAPYVSVAYVKRNDLTPWCGTNSVTFPATNSKTYALTVYVKSTTTPPTNGEPMTLQIIWQ